MAPRYIDTRRRAAGDRSQIAPRSRMIVGNFRDDYDQGMGSVQLTPARLGMYFRQANMGSTEALYDVFDVVEQDPHVHAVLSKRKRRVHGRQLQVAAAGDTPQAQQAADLVNELVFGEGGRGGIENLSEGLRDICDAIGKGFSLANIEWDSSGRWTRPVKLWRWPQRFCYLGDPSDWQARDVDQVRVITQEDLHRGVPLDGYRWGTWIKHQAKARSGPLARSALLRSVCWWYLFKHFSVRDWAIFTERYGMPLRLGKYPIGMDDTERSALEEAVINLGKDGGAVLPEGSTMELIESKITGTHPHSALATFCNAEISKAIEGTTLTTEQGDRGARSLGEVHQGEQGPTTDEDATGVALTLKRDLFTPIVVFNLGANYPIPTASFPEDEDEDFEAMARTDSILVNEIGLPLAEDYFYDRYDRPRPEKGAVVVRGKPAPAPIAPDAEGDEDEDEDEDAAVDQAAAATGLSPQAVRTLARHDPRSLLELAGVKKKSRAWAK